MHKDDALYLSELDRLYNLYDKDIHRASYEARINVQRIKKGLQTLDVVSRDYRKQDEKEDDKYE